MAVGARQDREAKGSSRGGGRVRASNEKEGEQVPPHVIWYRIKRNTASCLDSDRIDDMTGQEQQMVPLVP